MLLKNLLPARQRHHIRGKLLECRPSETRYRLFARRTLPAFRSSMLDIMQKRIYFCRGNIGMKLQIELRIEPCGWFSQFVQSVLGEVG